MAIYMLIAQRVRHILTVPLYPASPISLVRRLVMSLLLMVKTVAMISKNGIYHGVLIMIIIMIVMKILLMQNYII